MVTVTKSRKMVTVTIFLEIHWDGAKDEEVIVQIMGIGPSATIRVDESGQPKK